MPGSALDEQYQLYLEERKALIAAQRETASSFDKAILSLASGAFGVSVVFLKDIVPQPLADTKWLLGSSWAAFATSLVTILVGFLASQHACTCQIDVAYRRLVQESNDKTRNRWSLVAHVCNWS